MDPLFMLLASALVGGISAVISTVGQRAVDAWYARRSGVGPMQTELVNTLQETADARGDRIADLEAQLEDEREKRERLEKRVAKLEAALENCYGALERRGIPRPEKP